MKLIGIEKAQTSTRDWVIGIISTIINAFVLSLMIINTGAETMGQAIMIAVLLWLGFIATISVGTIIWEKNLLNCIY